MRRAADHIAADAEVLVDERPLPKRGPVVLIMHKPAGFISATTDAHHRTILDLVPPELRRAGLAPAGRLDKDTTGLIILTDDGALNHRLTHPRRHLPKTYEATLAAPLPSEAIDAVRAGLTLGDGTALKPGDLTLLAPLPDGTPQVRLVIHEGRYHQVKRMMAALGSAVLTLHRVAVGGLCLPGDLQPGACRPLRDDERALLLAEPGVPTADASSERSG